MCTGAEGRLGSIRGDGSGSTGNFLLFLVVDGRC